MSQIHDGTINHETQSLYNDENETPAEIDSLERITSNVVDKFFYDEKTKLNENDQNIFNILTKLRELVLDDLKSNPAGDKTKVILTFFLHFVY